MEAIREHFRQHDWNQWRGGFNYIEVKHMDNCTIEKIIQNKFWNPLISSDDEDDEPLKKKIDWSKVIKNQTNEQNEVQFRVFVPGMRAFQLHPKLSSLTKEEHRQCMKVLCALNKSILPKAFIGKPIKADYAVFEETKEKYAKEQKEFLEWAKNLWVTTNCIRALRPKPLIETVYEAEFKMKAQRIQFFPTKYTSAAQIPLRAENYKCEIIFPKEDLFKVNKSDIPEVVYPEIYDGRVHIQRPCKLPQPCDQHPCKFVLPNEVNESLLPLPEIHKELAQFALEHGAEFIASENAIKCILETDHTWTLPVSVCDVIAADGEHSNVVVLGSEFYLKKDSAPMRSYRAYRHLLAKAFTQSKTKPSRVGVSERPSTSRAPPRSPRASRSPRAPSPAPASAPAPMDSDDDSDSADEDRLQICVEDEPEADNDKNPEVLQFLARNEKPRKILKGTRRLPKSLENTEIKLYDCACKGTDFESPPPRSYKNWQIKNHTTKEKVNIIIHCPHKFQNSLKHEVLLEPIVEYQLDVGGTLQSQRKLHSLAFSMNLRDNAHLINVRVDGVSGELVTIDTLDRSEFFALHGDYNDETGNAIYTVLNQLAGLLPGDYLLRHEPSHGSNAILFSSKSSLGLETLAVDWEDCLLPPAEEAKLVQSPPLLGPVLLPSHKHRQQLPLAFTFDQSLVTKEPPKPAARTRAPPPALQWPKKKGNRKQKKKKPRLH